MDKTNAPEKKHPVVYYDGDCVLCGRSVMFIIHHDHEKKFRFISLRANPLKISLKDIGKDSYSLKSIILEEDGRRRYRTDAILRIFWILGGWLRITAVLRLIPAPARDGVYNWIAGNRYKWFGHEQDYLKPGADIEDRFLDNS